VRLQQRSVAVKLLCTLYSNLAGHVRPHKDVIDQSPLCRSGTTNAFLTQLLCCRGCCLLSVTHRVSKWKAQKQCRTSNAFPTHLLCCQGCCLVPVTHRVSTRKTQPLEVPSISLRLSMPKQTVDVEAKQTGPKPRIFKGSHGSHTGYTSNDVLHVAKRLQRDCCTTCTLPAMLHCCSRKNGSTHTQFGQLSYTEAASSASSGRGGGARSAKRARKRQ
jgi:hypothetical protein